MKFFYELLVILGSVLFCSVTYASNWVTYDQIWVFDDALCASPGVYFTLEEENSAFADFNSFGVFQSDGSQFYGVEVFSGSDGVGTEKVFGTPELARIDRWGAFGFYIDTPNGLFTNTNIELDLVPDHYTFDFMQTYYTETDEPLYHLDDPYDDPDYHNPYKHYYTLYFEDTAPEGRYDFDDMVVRVSGMLPMIHGPHQPEYPEISDPGNYPTSPTPLPGAAFLLLAGLPFIFKKRG
ncbi:hypothetical protein [Desulfoplanes formicivorans]|uniref:Uncharacterized protein n=1 Tax=Desulfoplanes formicivorans TaxID=1592317 RepID=A0A194ADJ9_9BACT|nr:hypothetical protein [Desulfoplanes formicivorans]GAU08157.1 hypothetical protein DPF_0860 [Desulfoplanes formicivorans]